MNVFVFQSVPHRLDLRNAILEGKQDTWYATRYRSDMKPGDIVFFWMAGDEHFRGLYGWGKIASTPYIKPGWDSHGIDVIYKCKFKKPILAHSIREDKELADMLIFRAPQATNFLLETSQAKRLNKLIKDRGETTPSLEEIKR
jgi:hypothetical protein